MSPDDKKLRVIWSQQRIPVLINKFFKSFRSLLTHRIIIKTAKQQDMS